MFFAFPILTMMHLRIMLYAHWTTLVLGTYWTSLVLFVLHFVWGRRQHHIPPTYEKFIEPGLSTYLYVYLSAYLSVYLSVFLSICLSACRSICLYVYLSQLGAWLVEW